MSSVLSEQLTQLENSDSLITNYFSSSTICVQ